MQQVDQVQSVDSLDPAVFTGKWEGPGVVTFRGKAIPYVETTEFTLIRTEPCMVLNYQQFTKHPTTGKHMHVENGFWKIQPAGPDGQRKIEGSFSHGFSLNEFELGFVGKNAETGNLTVSMAGDDRLIQRPPEPEDEESKSNVTTGLKREYWVDSEGALNYKTFLGVNGKEPTEHFSAKLTKVMPPLE